MSSDIMQGRNANVKFGATAGVIATGAITAPTTINFLSNANNWDISKEIEVKDYAVFGNDGYKKKAPALQSWSASVKAYFDAEDTTGQLALITAFDAGTKVYFEFEVNATNKYQGNCFIKSLKTSAAADGEVSFDIELEGDSKLFYA